MLEVFFKSQYKTTAGNRVVQVEARRPGTTEGAIHDVTLPPGATSQQAYQAIAKQVATGVPEADPLRDEIQKWIDSKSPWAVNPAEFLAPVKSAEAVTE